DTLEDTFQYVIEDARGVVDTGVVTVTVSGVNDDPVAVPDSYATDENTALTVDAAAGLVDNDSDVDGDTPVVIAVGSGEMGAAISYSSNGGFTYNPVASAEIQALPEG